MNHYRSLDDLQPLSESDPELWREAYGFMSICRKELLDQDELDDDHDFNFLIATEDDADRLTDLSDPEEWALIKIHSYGDKRTIYKVVSVTEVLFIPGELASHLSFINS